MTRTPPRFEDLYPGFPAPQFEPLLFERLPLGESLERARDFYAELSRRRTTRQFSSEAVPQEIIELCVLAAGTAPSGAHRQPWRFVAVPGPELKRGCARPPRPRNT